MKHLFCSACGDHVNAVFPCKFVFHDGLTKDFDICLDCMKTGTLEINLPRQRQVAQIIYRIAARRLWKKRADLG